MSVPHERGRELDDTRLQDYEVQGGAVPNYITYLDMEG